MDSDLTNNEETLIDNDAPEDDGDRISVFQWVMLFVVLGVIIYFSPLLFGLFPK